MSKTIDWYAQRYAERFGMALVPLHVRGKLPMRQDWGNQTITDPAEAETYWAEHPEHNIGMALGPSGYCSLDIDCLESFAAALAEFGLPIEDLDQYPTIVGAPKGKRVVFRVPPGTELPYAKLTWPTEADQTKRYTVMELRAATGDKQRHDVLPPSMHPDTGEPYRWTTQPREDWPEPPPWLIAIWESWDKFKPQLQDACPWAEKRTAPQPTKPRTDSDRSESGASGVIAAYCDAHDLSGTLVQYGYQPMGKRYMSPHSTTRLAGVVVLSDGRACWIHHASDPLCSEESGQPVNAFDLFCYYEHGGDLHKALSAAEQELGIKPEPRARANTGAAQTVREDAPPEPEASEAPDPTPEPTAGPPFRALGYNGNSYYYLPRATEQVSEIRRSSHTSPAEMLSMAPLEWWEMAYPKEKGGVDWHVAASELMRACERRGIYTPEVERGRGAWYDDGQAVLHLGDRILVDGHPKAIADHKSRHVYTRQGAMESDVGAVAATDEESERVLDLIRQLNWSMPHHATMLSGWVALAPICGALSWRPHVWLTAQRGSGKSWVQDHLIYPLIGRSALHVQGGTTEAGIRQRLRQDARPVIFDEAEPDGQRGQHRIQSVIELARQASSDSGAEIVKGTAGGEGMAFRARSMFLMGSVNVGLHQAADESRFSVISLEAPPKSSSELERFAAFSREVDATITRELCASIRARMYRMIPTIRANAATFARAVAEELGSQRIGDQVGTLLAGHHAMLTTEEVTLDQARAIASQVDVDEARESEQVSDEHMLIEHILQAQIRFDAGGSHMQRSIGEVVECASGGGGLGGLGSGDANDVLARFGLRVDGRSLLVSNNHTELRRILSDTPWGAGWKTILRRLPGAACPKQSYRLAGTPTRVTSIPMESIQ